MLVVVPWSENLPQFSAVAAVLAGLLFLYAAVGEPLLGRYAFRWLERRRPDDPKALERFYSFTLAVQWTWTALVVCILLLSPGLAATDLGVRLPDNWGPLLGAVIGFAAALGIAWLIARRSGRRSGRRGSSADDSAPGSGTGAKTLVTLAPRSRRERRLGAAVGVTAGICEEVLYRGLFVALGVSFGLPLAAAAVLSCVVFALAHIYQGWWGLVGPGLLGALFMVIYLGTASLLIPIALHLVLDLRALLLTGSGRRHRSVEL